MKTWLADDILVKADRSSMAHGLELRAPFLDHRLIEFAAALPIDWKLRGLKTKDVLKRSQRGRLAPHVLRRRKQGFNAPVSHWLTTSFRSAFERLTVEGAGLPLFEPRYVTRLWQEHAAGERDHGHKLLGLIQLQLWCRQHQPSLD
jgi:asparagine synthase (glutamine-hydrolysing)